MNTGVPIDGGAADIEGFTHRFAEVNHTRIHFVIGGSGPAVFLLHGWPTSWREWRKVMPRLATAGYTVIAPDLRGLGDSDRPASGYDKATVADDIRHLMRILGFDTVDLVGSDIGGMVAFSWALRHPNEIRRLVIAETLLPGFGLEELMNPATGGYWHFGFHAQVELATMLTEGKEEAYLGKNWSMFSPLDGITAEDRTAFLRTYGHSDGMRAGFKHYESLIEDGKANRAAFTTKLATPVLTLNAELGIPQGQTLSSVESAFIDVQYDTVPRAGHAFAADSPDWTADRIAAFLRS